MLEVVEAGLLTTVQDAGRPDYTHLGVPIGGAADPWSLAVANILAGNDPGAAALEATIVGPTLRAEADVRVAIAGADLGARLDPPGAHVPPGRSVVLKAGSTLALAGSPAARGSGARAYVAPAGGVDVPVVLGSRSTCLPGSFGGLDGRPLRAGDLVPIGLAPGGRGTAPDAWPADPIAPRRQAPDGTLVVRVLPGLEGDGRSALAATDWTVAPASDRMGLRLQGGRDQPASTVERHVTSHGVVRGAVQLPPDGGPILMLADHQPTGGYPVVAVVIAADLPALGQLAPGDRVRFLPVTLEEARRALLEQRERWAAILALLGADREWDDLWKSAGA